MPKKKKATKKKLGRPSGPTQKTCSDCGRTKPRALHFGKNANSKDGHSNVCAKCLSAKHAKAWLRRKAASRKAVDAAFPRTPKPIRKPFPPKPKGNGSLVKIDDFTELRDALQVKQLESLRRLKIIDAALAALE
jgi:hypothetical protein